MRASLIIAVILFSSGCVKRTLTIESSPAGARVILNGSPLGKTPLTVPFRHYGVYRVELAHHKADRLITELELKSPWYYRFPIGIFPELLWPGTINDDRYVKYELKNGTPPTREELIKKSDAAILNANKP